MLRLINMGIVAMMGTIKKSITASGGIEYEVGDYKVHAFTTVGNNTFNVEYGGEMDVLVIAGGGGRGYQNVQEVTPPGGAGGVLFSRREVGDGTYTLTVGGGGADKPVGGSSGFGTNGGNSLAFGLTAIGGGGGGYSNNDGRDGGSGGGAYGGSYSPSGGKGTTGQGNAGGNASQAGAGGGGGYSTAGGVSNRNLAGAGGDGIKEVEIDGVTTSLISMYGNNYGQLSDGDIWFAGGLGGKRGGSTTLGKNGKGYNAQGGSGKNGIILIRYLKD